MIELRSVSMPPVISEASLRKEICDAGRVLYERGLIGPVDGNFSARVGERYIVCTPSGAHKGELRPDDLVKLTLDGRVVTPGGKPSSELRMHLAIYRLRPDVRCIVHAHPPDRKSTRLNSSHVSISYAVFCLKKKKQIK